MSRFDRYFLSQLLLVFGFFSLVLVGVLWINSAVGLFDRLISGGQSAVVFLEFTLLSLPTLIRTVMPMAVFAAAVYVTNRLSRESELTVMLATGSTPWRIARGALAFGLTTGLLMMILTHVLRPASILQLEQREAEVSIDAAAVLLNEGQFRHIQNGITFYIGEIDTDSTLNDVFLSDRRNPGTQVTYTGSRGFLVRRGEEAKLILVYGMAQSLDVETKQLSTTSFADLSYDITQLLERQVRQTSDIRGLTTPDLIWNRPELLAAANNRTEGELVQELHERNGWALICLAVAMVGFSTLLLGGFSRFGLWPQITFAFVLLIGLELFRGMISPMIVADPKLWPLTYVPSAIGFCVAYAFSWMSGRPLSLRRRSGHGTTATPQQTGS